MSHTVPIVATSLACQGMYQHPKQFSAAEKRSRNWFSLWMAIISFCVAVAQVVDDEDNSVRCPAWFRCLVRYVDERTASGLRQQLSQFTGAYTRAGIFLNLLEDNHTQQPTVEFYVRFGVPVWYHWGHREEALAQSNPEGFGRFVPPPHLLQTARSFLIKEPAVIPTIKARPWEVFFQERKRRGENAGLAPRKTPTLKVFLWEQDSEGKWMRVLVRSEERQVTLKQYGRRQKVFDERSNEWDCCEAMGNLDPDEEHCSDNDSILRNERRTGSPTHCEPHDSAAFPAVSGESVRCYTRTPSPEPPSDSVSPSRSNERSVMAARSVLITSSNDRRLTMSYTEMTTKASFSDDRPVSTAASMSTTSLAGSINSSAGRKQGPAVAPRRGAKKVRHVEALYTYDPSGEGETAMQEGEKMVLLSPDQGDGWCEVEGKAGRGVVPAGWVKEV